MPTETSLKPNLTIYKSLQSIVQGFIESQLRNWESYNFSNNFRQIETLKLVNRLFLMGEIIYKGLLRPTKLSWLAEGLLPI